jgi:hypothetical protein
MHTVKGQEEASVQSKQKNTSGRRVTHARGVHDGNSRHKVPMRTKNSPKGKTKILIFSE